MYRINTATGSGGSSSVLAVADESLSVGSLLSVATDGAVLEASAIYTTDRWRLIAVSQQAVNTSEIVVLALSGSLTSVLMEAPPLSAQNGSLVFLSTTTGKGTLTPPMSSGNVIFQVGVLRGANGVTDTPQVFFQPQYISRVP